MKRNIFIIHGSYGSPQENWFPWLKKELEKLGRRVFVPQFPVPKKITPGGHQLKDWLKEFDKYRKFVNENTIIIAHSRGAVFCYHLLPTFPEPIDSVFLVGGWLNYHWYKKSRKTNSFHKKPFLWEKIKKSARYFEFYQSNNDPTGIPVSDGKTVAKYLDAKFILVKETGHFSLSYDKQYDTFPLLLENIKKRL
ncbi:alpha/beta hydrolase [Candidatus Roizmanbacteria bacterium]|nr:alpha/beta hydrolase [Candidatus Roizmanbacteria bacterium]